MSNKVTKATYHVLFGTVAGRVINLLALLLVTSKLGPNGFGQLLVVGIITALFDTLLDIGFENYYIIRVSLKDTDKESLQRIEEIENAIFKLRLFSNLILFTLQIAASYLLVGILFESPIDSYLRILAFNYLAAIMGKINEVRMKKRMEFGPITKAKFISNLASAGVRVLLVYAGYGILGWAGGLVFGTFIYNGLLVKYGSFKPKLIAFSDTIKKEVWWFAKHSWLMGLGQYLHSQSSNWLLKFFNNVNQIGFIQFSSSYTLDVHSGMFASQAPLLFSYYSNHKDEPPKILNAISQMASVGYLLLGVPLIMSMIFAEPIISLLFDSKWQPAVPVLMVYSLYTFVRISYSPGIGIHNAIGKLKVGTLVTYIQLFLTIAVLLFVGFMNAGIYWFAVAFVVLNVIGENLKVFSGLYFLKIYPHHFFKHNLRIYVIMLILMALAYGIKLIISVKSIACLIAIGTFLYVVFVVLLWVFNRSFCITMLHKLQSIVPANKFLFVSNAIQRIIKS